MGSPIRAGAAATAILIVLVSLGCGSGDTTPPSTETAAAEAKNGRNIRKLRWQWHATMACKKGMEQADLVMHKAVGDPVPRPPSAAPDWESFKLPVKVLLPTFRQTLHELEAVETEPEDAYEFGKVLDSLKEDLQQAERHPGVPISSRPLASGGKAAYVYGIHACLY